MKQQTHRIHTHKLVLTALLIGFIAILTFTPLGYLSFPPVAATTVHIPVVIGAALLGPYYGALLGLVFGLSSLLRAVMQPDPFSVIFLNPLVSVLPRVLCGFAAGYAFRALARRGKELPGAALGAVAGTLTNTVGVLGMILLINPVALLSTSDVTANVLRVVLGGVLLTNTLPEVIVAVLVAMGVYKAGKPYYKRYLN